MATAPTTSIARNADADLLQQTTERAYTEGCARLGELMAQLLRDRGGARNESPIEIVFDVWWTTLSVVGSDYVRRMTLDRQYAIECADGSCYRADFRVRLKDHPLTCRCCLRILIELDGHDWHERTPEQVAQRDRRDRRLQADGWMVLHFSGSELMRDSAKCVDEVIEIATLELIELDARAKAAPRG